MSPSSTSTGPVSAPADRLDTLPAATADGNYWWRPGVLTAGHSAIEWAERWLVQPNGPRAGQPFRLTPRQMRFLLTWYEVDGSGAWLHHHGVRRLAKGPIAHETPVATPSGWVKHGDLSVGDELFAVDGSTTTVTAVHAEVTEDCWRLTFRDGSSIVCTGSHRWEMDQFTGSGRSRRIVTVKEMVAAGVTWRRPLTTGRTKASKAGVARWCALPTPPIDGSAADYPVPPYLLGYWLGDGDSDCPRVTVHVNDIASLEAQCARLGVECGPPRPTHRETYRIRFGRGWAQAALRCAGLLHDKHIPMRLLRSSVDQRWELLRGIVDSDGTVSKTGTVEVSVMVGRLADDIFELAVSLGLMPTRTDSDARLNGRVVGRRARIRFTPQPGEVVSLLPRKAQRVRTERSHGRPFSRSRTVVAIDPVPAIPARCITVAHPSHQYLVGERNVPTCNSGKSPFAAVLALIEFAGPCRVERIRDPDDPVPGRRVAVVPVAMPWVQIAATAESQTKNTMRMVRAFASKQSAVVKEHGIDPGKTVYYRMPEGRLEVITSSSTAAEGAEASFIVADEVEHWRPSNGGPELSATLADNLAKSGSRMLETSNAWTPGVDTVAESTWDAWVAQEEGRTKSATTILYDALLAPPDTDMADPESLHSALSTIYADCPWVDVRVIMARIHDLRSRPDDSRRKYLNRPTAADDAWTTAEDWAQLTDVDQVVNDGETIVAFFDGSKSEDATALVGCRVSDGHVITLAAWEKPDGPAGDDWEVPVDEVDAAVAWMFDRFDVAAFFADVREWESFVHTAWPEAHGDGLVLWASPNGRNASPIAWDMRGHVMEFTRSAEACLSAIEGREFTHDGHSVVQRHVVNARRRPNRWGVSIGKESRMSPRKIDAAICVIGARMVRRQLLASPEWAKRTALPSKAAGRVVGW